ncbi:MAG: TetR/AcrR family transcriptional regulator, partial [Mycobacteriales bacterium]
NGRDEGGGCRQMTTVTPGPDDPLREELLDAAARVFARAGYEGTRVQDIVREAGLSTGAVYGRFRSKNELLREAVISRSTPHVHATDPGVARVADLVARGATADRGSLTDVEALLLETYVTARREPEVAAAVREADRRWNEAVAPLVEAALRDGTVAEGVDPQAVLFLVKVLRLGLLLHRGSGLPRPDQVAWETLVAGVVASFGTP